MVTPVSPSGSLTVAVSVWSSVVVPLRETAPMVLTLATAMVNDCVTAVVPSVADRTTALLPTSSLSGVPVRSPLFMDNQLGHVVHDTVTVWPSGSLVVMS